MNAAQRKTLSAALAALSAVKEALENAHSVAEELANEEQEKFDNMPEGLQQSERGQAIEGAASTLNEIADHLQTALDALEEAEGRDIP